MTKKELQDQLERERQQSNRYYQEWQKCKNELEDKVSARIQAMQVDESRSQAEIRRLMQIIRIVTKDETLKLELEFDNQNRIGHSGLY